VPSAPADSHITEVATGLQNPRGLAFDGAGNLYVAEAGIGGDSPCAPGPEGGDSCYGETSGITKITDPGGSPAASRIIDGLPSHAIQVDNPDTPFSEVGSEAIGAGDVSIGTDGFLYYTVGLGADPAARTDTDAFGDGAKSDLFATIRMAATDGTGDTEVADVGDFETAENPDTGLPGMGFLDTNPFGLVADTTTLEFVDSGGNFQASVDLTAGPTFGDISTTVVFPPAFTPLPAFVPAPAGTRIPAQPVPTQLVADPDGGYFVGQLTGFPFHLGAASVFHTSDDGAMQYLMRGFTNIMDVAWHEEMLYVLEISHDGLLAGVGGGLWRVDPDTGVRELLANGDDLLAPGGIAFGLDGMAYITVGSPLADGAVIQFDVDNAPVLLTLKDDAVTTPEDEPVAVEVTANDDADATVTAVPDNSAGAAWTGSIEYQPPAHFTGVDTVTYQACDPDDNCGIAVLTVTVTADSVDRIDGVGREETAIQASRAVFPDGAPAVLLTRGDIYPDALTGSVLAATVGGPILLNDRDQLRDEVAAEINRLGATTAYVLGGPVSQSEDIESELTSGTSVTTVVRVGGANRFETASLIKDEVEELTGDPSGAVYVTEGDDPDPARGWPDAVSIGALAAHQVRPILLVTTDVLPAATSAALQGVPAATIVGGPFSVSDAVKSSIDAVAGTVDRLAGDTRYGTSLAVADASKAAGLDPAKLWLASGAKFPDALVIGPLVAIDGGVMMLVAPDDLGNSPPTKAFIESNGPYTDVDLAGGPNTISTTVEAQIAALLAG
jgi:putative cell wall-binding protein